MSKKDPISRTPNARPVPVPQPKQDPSPGRLPSDIPTWKPDYSKYTRKK